MKQNISTCTEQAEFKRKTIEVILTLLHTLTEEERMNVFHCFCIHCGTSYLPCHCWKF